MREKECTFGLYSWDYKLQPRSTEAQGKSLLKREGIKERFFRRRAFWRKWGTFGFFFFPPLSLASSLFYSFDIKECNFFFFFSSSLAGSSGLFICQVSEIRKNVEKIRVIIVLWQDFNTPLQGGNSKCAPYFSSEHHFPDLVNHFTI